MERLNSITVKSKFAIRVMDELFDELEASTKFGYKLELKVGYHYANNNKNG